MAEHNIVGQIGEDTACQMMKKKGYRIAETNWRFGHLEMDIIAINRREIVFVEVKTRSLESKCGLEARPASAVNPDKQRKLIHVANEYARRTHKKDGVLMRMDIIEIYTEKNENGKTEIKNVIHIENAFDMNSAYQNFRG
jgi:putative endonuclease